MVKGFHRVVIALQQRQQAKISENNQIKTVPQYKRYVE
jgi:hypothetical protein